jgi:threo-3-hydroxy-L-aspartate ammonia-lyase
VISIDDVRAAAARLDGIAHRTSVITSKTLDELAGGTVLLKAENFQRAGAFKFRGAYNKISSLDAPSLRRGVATFSSGNHAQAVALAARLLGANAVILMPEDAPKAKVEATISYGAEVVYYDRYEADRAELGRALAEERGMALVPPYDDPLIIAGQGTGALELIEDAGPIDVLVVPVGGGGLIAGCATAARALNPRIRIVGVEPVAGDDTRQSFASGKRVRIAVPRTIADGQQVEIPGEITFEINRKLVDDIAVVTDDEIVAAMAFSFDRLKIVLEPSGASGLAAVLAGKVDVRNSRAGVILSGGNVGLERFVRLIGTQAEAAS